MVSALAGVVAVLALTAATGYFVAQEFAFVAADRARLDADAERGDTRARRALAVMSRLSFVLSGAQLGITVTALVVGFLAEPATSALIEPVLSAAGVPGPARQPAALVTGFVLATVVQMVLGELLPKNLALARAEPLAKSLASSSLAYLAVAGPLIRLFDAAAIRLLRAVGVEPVEELRHGATLTELSDIIGESRQSGRLPVELSTVLQRALSFGERTATEAMIPRPDVVTVPATATTDDLAELIAAAGHTDYPVCGRDIDDIAGIVGVRELTALETASPAPSTSPAAPASPASPAPSTPSTSPAAPAAPVSPAGPSAFPAWTSRPVGELVRPALLIPDTLPLQQVIGRMRETGEEFACVVDEYGGLAGILTFEDIAEQLVGEITDENDPQPRVPIRSAGHWELAGAMRIAQVRDLTGLALPPDPAYDSVSGLVMARLGRLPQVGDLIEIDLDADAGPPGRAEIEVLAVRRRIARSVALRTAGGSGGQGDHDGRGEELP